MKLIDSTGKMSTSAAVDIPVQVQVQVHVAELDQGECAIVTLPFELGAPP